MNLSKSLIITTAIAVIGLSFQSCNYKAKADETRTTNINKTVKAVTVANKSEQVIKWHSITELEDLQAKAPKKVIVDIYTDWCKWCKVMDEKTFTNSALISYLNKHYYMVKFNAETMDDITFKGHQFNFVQSGRRGHNTLATKLTKGKLAFPSFAVLNEDLVTTQVINGFKEASQFQALLEKETM